MDVKKDMRASAHEYASRARDRGSEVRGFVAVDEGVWAWARCEGGVEIMHRKPTADERRSALEGARADKRGAPATSAVVLRSAADIAPRRTPDSQAAKRLTKLFGAER
jgi:hypothetical protein